MTSCGSVQFGKPGALFGKQVAASSRGDPAVLRRPVKFGSKGASRDRRKGRLGRGTASVTHKIIARISGA